jgi:hypothetical protein
VKKLQLLSEKGLVRVIGPIPNEPRLAMLAWARKPPKAPFKAFVRLNNQLSANALSVFIDDLCAMITTQHSRCEQVIINSQYTSFFSELGCKTVFSRELLDCDEDLHILNNILRFASKIPFSVFMQTLPGHKKRAMQDLDMGELLHGIIELMCLEEISRISDGIIMGEVSLAIAMLHRNISTKPLSIVTVPHFDSENAVTEFITRIES